MHYFDFICSFLDMAEEEKFPWTVSHYEVTQHVGGGSYGTVFLCKSNKDKKEKKVMP